MPLTPEDVQSKRFTVTRFKAGYDEEEVDAFLDEVEAELRRLLTENAELRDRLAAVSGGAPIEPAAAELGGGPTEPAEPPPAAPPAEPQPADTGPFPAVAAQAPPEPSPARTGPLATVELDHELDQLSEAGSGEEAALRTLRAAQRTADGIVAEARGEAQQILVMARERSAAVEQETRERQNAALAALAQQRQDLENRVEGLRAFERDYRTRIRAYLEGQLRELDRTHLEPPRPGAGGPPGSAGFGSGALTPPPTFAPSPAGGPGDSRAAGPSPWTMAPSPAMQPAPGRGAGPAPLRGPRDGRVETDTGEVDEQHDGGAG
jgi:DivIVA domain-containing protein